MFYFSRRIVKKGKQVQTKNPWEIVRVCLLGEQRLAQLTKVVSENDKVRLTFPSIEQSLIH